MKKYIRVCLSLNDEYIEKLKMLSRFYNRSLSDVVKLLIDSDIRDIKGN